MPKYEDPELEQETGEDAPLETFFYHQRKALEETARALEALLPPGFKEHSTQAGKEFVQGFKVLVDATIDELKKVSERAEDEEEENGDDTSTTGSGKVKVQVD